MGLLKNSSQVDKFTKKEKRRLLFLSMDHQKKKNRKKRTNDAAKCQVTHRNNPWNALISQLLDSPDSTGPPEVTGPLEKVLLFYGQGVLRGAFLLSKKWPLMFFWVVTFWHLFFFEWRSCWVVKLTVFSFLDFSTRYYEDMGCIPPLGE